MRKNEASGALIYSWGAKVEKAQRGSGGVDVREECFVVGDREKSIEARGKKGEESQKKEKRGGENKWRRASARDDRIRDRTHRCAGQPVVRGKRAPEISRGRGTSEGAQHVVGG